MKITHFSPQDQSQISDFWFEIFNEMGWKANIADGFDDVPTYFHFSEGGFLLLAKDEGSVVGCGGVKPLSNEASIIKRFYVTKKMRGKGLSTELLDELIKESKRRGFKELVLDVWNKNPRAVSFYEKNGFEKYFPKPTKGWAESSRPEIFFYYRKKLTNL